MINEILELMKKPYYKPLRSRELANRLRIPKEYRPSFKKHLRELVEGGEIERIKGGRYSMPGSQTAEKDEPPKAKPKQITKSKKKLLGTLVKTGETGMIMLRGVKIPPLVVAPSDIKHIKSGSLVVAGFSRQRGKGGRLMGVIYKVLGKAGTLKCERKALYYEYELPKSFPRGTKNEALAIPKGIDNGELGRRKDLRGLPIVTIDGETAKDFDDAVTIKRTKTGYKLWVSIADVSHYVTIGSALDNEALDRGTSVYLADDVVPMLPEELSNWICSLVPDEDRFTKTVEIDFDNMGFITGTQFYNSVIKSHARLTYTEVSKFLEGKTEKYPFGKVVSESLLTMRELYGKLKKNRMDKGELDFDFPDTELIRDELGRTVDVVKVTRNVAHGLIEEFMIVANTAVGDYVFESQTPSIYRIHETPDPETLKELSWDLRKFGYELDVEGGVEAHDIQKVIEQSRGAASKLAVHILILRSLNRAVYSTSTANHFGLAIDHYTHFTSPIRRYADLIVHRIIDSLMHEQPTPYDMATLDWISSHVSAEERHADEAERESIKIEKVDMMKPHVGKEFEGYVISVLPFGIFVELSDYFVDGLVPRDKLKFRGKKKYEVGDLVKVILTEADLERRRITFDLAR